MKKIIMSLGLCVCVGFAAMAQDLVVVEETSDNAAFTTKRGVPILPQAGDFAIGIDATPILNIFNINPSTDPAWNGVPDFLNKATIYGKYFIEDNRAIRAKLSVGVGSDTYKGVVRDDAEVTNNPLNANATVVDMMKQSATGLGLTVGYEMRRGRGRVQGFYGAEVGVGYSSNKYVYEYANPMTAANQAPTTWDFTSSSAAANGNRPTEVKGGNTISATVAGFVGAEYFIAPQLSIGGEFNLGFVYGSTNQTETTSEMWNASANKVDTQTKRSGEWIGNSSWLKTKTQGVLFIMFHF